MKQKNLIFIGIVLLAFLAGTFVFPDYFNKGVDFLNKEAGFGFLIFGQNLSGWALICREG